MIWSGLKAIRRQKQLVTRGIPLLEPSADLLKTLCLSTVPGGMNIRVTFYSYFKELTGVPSTTVAVAEGATLGELFEVLLKDYPKLEPMRKSTLLAVGVDYQPRDYGLKDGDEVALFPPVQGG